MSYFGEPYPSEDYPASIYDGDDQVPTPVGELCLWCDDPIVEGERGFIQGCFIRRDKTGSIVPTREPIHQECSMRSTIGSAKHQRGECGCFTGVFGEDDDAEYPTKRAAALAAVAEFESRIDDPDWLAARARARDRT